MHDDILQAGRVIASQFGVEGQASSPVVAGAPPRRHGAQRQPGGPHPEPGLPGVQESRQLGGESPFAPRRDGRGDRVPFRRLDQQRIAG